MTKTTVEYIKLSQITKSENKQTRILLDYIKQSFKTNPGPWETLETSMEFLIEMHLTKPLCFLSVTHTQNPS